MKTIIARFTELKSNVDETGEDLEGMDFNKVDKALKSVGVQLKDTTGSFRNLDDVFLELSGKWDTLTRNQQRYIATIAAGSRQQSRFIAMMEDYDRTLELVETAQNSVGRSDEQFAKYADTITYRLNQLKNSWEELRVSFLGADEYKEGLDYVNNFLKSIKNVNPKILLADVAIFGFIGNSIIQSIIKSLKMNSNKIASEFNKTAKSMGNATANAISRGIQEGIDKSKFSAQKRLTSLISERGIAVDASKINNDNAQQIFKLNNLAGDRQKEIRDARQLIQLNSDLRFSIESQALAWRETGESVEVLKNNIKDYLIYEKEGEGNAEKISQIYAQRELKIREIGVEEAKIRATLMEEGFSEEEINNLVNTRIQLLGQEQQKIDQIAQKSKNYFVNQMAPTLASGVSNAIVMGVMTAVTTGDWSNVGKTMGATLLFSLAPILTEGITAAINLALGAIAAAPIIGVIGIAIAAAAAIAFTAFYKNSVEGRLKQLKKEKEKLEQEASDLQSVYSEKRAQRDEYKEEKKDLEELLKLHEEYQKDRFHTEEETQNYQNELKGYADDYSSVIKTQNGIYELQIGLLEQKLNLNKENLKVAEAESAVAKAAILRNELDQLDKDYEIAEANQEKLIGKDINDLNKNLVEHVSTEFINGAVGLDETSTSDEVMKLSEKERKRMSESIRQLTEMNDATGGQLLEQLGLNAEWLTDIDNHFSDILKVMQKIHNGNMDLNIDFNAKSEEMKGLDIQRESLVGGYEDILRDQAKGEEIDERVIDYILKNTGEINQDNYKSVVDSLRKGNKELQSGVDYLNKLIDNNFKFTKESLETLDISAAPDEVQKFLKDFIEKQEKELDAGELEEAFKDVLSFDTLDKNEIQNYKSNVDELSKQYADQEQFIETTRQLAESWEKDYKIDTEKATKIFGSLEPASVTIENYNEKLEDFISSIEEIEPKLSENDAKNIFEDFVNTYEQDGIINIQVVDDEKFKEKIDTAIEDFQKTLDADIPPIDVSVPVNIKDMETEDIEKFLDYLEESGESVQDYFDFDNDSFEVEEFLDYYNTAVEDQFNTIAKYPKQIAEEFAKTNGEIVSDYLETTNKEEIKSANELFTYYKDLSERSEELQGKELEFYEKYKDVFETALPNWEYAQSEAYKAVIQRYLSEKKKLKAELDLAKEDYEKYKNLLDLFDKKQQAETDSIEKRQEAQKKIDDQIKKNAEDEKKALKDINEALKDVEEQEQTILEKEQAIVDKTQELNDALYGTANYLSKRDSLQNYIDRIDQLSSAAEKAKKALDNPEVNDNISELVKNYGEAIHQEMVYQQALNQRKQDQKNQILGYLQGFGSEYFTMVDGFLQANYSAIDNAQMNDQLKDQIYQYLDDYNKVQKEIIEGEDKYNDLLKEMKERRKSALSDMVNLQKDTAEILKKSYEKEIEDVKEKYDAIKEADDEYLDALQEAIDKQRKLRDEENKWNDLATKEKKLSLISRDTSGSQQKETLKLQEEIEKDRQSLLDSSVDNILDTLKETYEEQQKEREEELEYQEKMIEDMDFMKQAMEVIQSMNGNSENYLTWLMENDPEYLEGSPLEQELYIENHANDLAPFEEYAAITNSNFQEYLEITAQEVDAAVSGMSDNMAEYLERSHQNTLDKVQEEQDAAQEALNQAFEDLDEAKLKLSELHEKVTEAYENYDTVIKEGTQSLNEAYENQKQVIKDTENDVKEATNTLKDSLLEIYGTTSITQEAVTQQAEDALSHYNTVQMDYHTKTEKIKDDLITWMEQVAIAAMDENALQAVQNARDVAANNVDDAADSGDIRVFKSASERFDQVVKEVGGLEQYIEQVKGQIKTSKIEANRDSLNADIDAYNAALQNYSKIDKQTPHLIAKSKAYSELDSLLSSIESKSGGEPQFDENSEFSIGDIFGVRQYRKINKYATGGMVDYTGPAWVDGTPNRPEAFLSAEDTARIGAAAQLLSNLPFLNTSSITDNSYSSNIGDTTIEVHINIENVSSERDIDDMINRVRDDIVSMSKQIGNPVLLNK